MSDSTRRRPDRLPLEVADQIDRICDRFDAAWSAGGRPRIEDYLGEAPDSARVALLRELLAADLEQRARLGEKPSPGEYLGRFPEHVATILDEFGHAPDDGPELGESTLHEAGVPGLHREGGDPAGMPAVAGYELLEELG